MIVVPRASSLAWQRVMGGTGHEPTRWVREWVPLGTTNCLERAGGGGRRDKADVGIAALSWETKMHPRDLDTQPAPMGWDGPKQRGEQAPAGQTPTKSRGFVRNTKAAWLRAPLSTKLTLFDTQAHQKPPGAGTKPQEGLWVRTGGTQQSQAVWDRGSEVRAAGPSNQGRQHEFLAMKEGL